MKIQMGIHYVAETKEKDWHSAQHSFMHMYADRMWKRCGDIFRE
jgi:hypothetical protein